MPVVEVVVVTRELVSVAYRLDLSEEEWLEGLFEILSRACPGEASIAQFSRGDLKGAVGEGAFFNALPVELLGPEKVGCNPLGGAKEVRRWIYWVESGNECVVYICAGPSPVKCPNWDSVVSVLRPALGIRTALLEKGVETEAVPLDLRSKLNQVILESDIVVQMHEPPLPPLVRTVWEGVLTGTWSLVDVQSAAHGWNVVAHKNADGFTDPRAMSAREQEVLRLLALGLSNKEIGYRMGISASSVASFMRRAMEKLHVESRVQLVAIAGVLGVPEPEVESVSSPEVNVARIAAELDQLLNSLSTENAKKSDMIELRKRLKKLGEIKID